VQLSTTHIKPIAVDANIQFPFRRANPTGYQQSMPFQASVVMKPVPNATCKTLNASSIV
jgi:hypothetical protein